MAEVNDVRWGLGSVTLLNDVGETPTPRWGLGSLQVFFEYVAGVVIPRFIMNWFLYFGNYSHRRR